MTRSLLLIPTDLERRVIEPAVVRAAGDACRVELCGFGIAAAAARTALLVATLQPPRVVLVGIAGRYDERLTIGAAYRFRRVACHGIGAGSGADFLPASAIGWPQWPGGAPDAGPPIGDEIDAGERPNPGVPVAGLLLTACAAAASAADVHLRRRISPDAVAEDMEGFGVALACRLAGVPFDLVRGISNDAGHRDKATWQVDGALEAAAAVAARLLVEEA